MGREIHGLHILTSNEQSDLLKVDILLMRIQGTIVATTFGYNSKLNKD